MDNLAVITLGTPRLSLRPFREGDLDAYAALCADPEVMQYVGDGGALNREDAWRQMAMLAGHWHLRGSVMWAVEAKATGQLLGRVGLHVLDRDRWPAAQPAHGAGNTRPIG